MGLRQYRPLTAGTRFRISDDYSDLTKFEPERSLLAPLKSKAGRDWRGRIAMRHRGGGNKIKYRLVDFKRDKDNIPAKVVGIEYDPNRNARIALLEYEDSERRYILAPLGIAVGDKLMSGEDVEIRPGNAAPMKFMPVGTVIHNVEMEPGRGGALARAAGAAVSLVAKEGDYAIIRLPSGEQRKIHILCRATVGQIGNLDSKHVRLGKAGKMRHIGRRPAVRGVAMNPCDHPHGGGEGKSGIGREQPVSKWGKPALGKKTRHPRRRSDRFILIRRK